MYRLAGEDLIYSGARQNPGGLQHTQLRGAPVRIAGALYGECLPS